MHNEAFDKQTLTRGARMMAGGWLPDFLRARLAGRETLRRALNNASWLFGEQLMRMGIGLVVGVWMARYLGPEAFGVLSYALAITAVVGACVSLGLNAVVVREAARAPSDAATWLGTAFVLRLLGAGAGLFICSVAAWLRPLNEPHSRGAILVVAAGLLFQVFDVFDLHFQASGVARISAWARMTACLLANGLKVVLMLAHASLVTLAFAIVAETLLTAIGLLWASRVRGWRITSWKFNRVMAAKLLHESWPLALSGLAVQAQAYADQVMLGTLLGGRELGQYAAAMRLISVFAFVPAVVQIVSAPEISRAKRDDENLYQQRLYRLYRLMFGLFLLTALPLILFGSTVVRLLYGTAYAGAAALLPWLALRLFLANFGIARSIFITNESLFRFALGTALAGAAVNLGFNFLLIPYLGACGAVVASLLSFTVTTFALEWLQTKARKNLRMMVLAVVLPWRRSID